MSPTPGPPSCRGVSGLCCSSNVVSYTWAVAGVNVLVTIPQLEMRCRNLRSTQQAASTENQQLEESNRVLENRLQHLHQQLRQTQGCLRTARAAVAWERAKEPG